MNLQFYEPDTEDLQEMMEVIQHHGHAFAADLDQFGAHARDAVGLDASMQQFLDTPVGEKVIEDLADKYNLTPKAFLFLMRLAVFGV